MDRVVKSWTEGSVHSVQPTVQPPCPLSRAAPVQYRMARPASRAVPLSCPLSSTGRPTKIPDFSYRKLQYFSIQKSPIFPHRKIQDFSQIKYRRKAVYNAPQSWVLRMQRRHCGYNPTGAVLASAQPEKIRPSHGRIRNKNNSILN